NTDSTTSTYPTPDTMYVFPTPVRLAQSAAHRAAPLQCADSQASAESGVAYSAHTGPAPGQTAPRPSTSHTRLESARPPSTPRSVHAARRAIAQVDHIRPPAHYTAAGAFPSATSLDPMQIK